MDSPQTHARAPPVPRQALRWLAAGAQFVAIGADTMLLHAAAKQLVASYRGTDGSVKNTY